MPQGHALLGDEEHCLKIAGSVQWSGEPEKAIFQQRHVWVAMKGHFFRGAILDSPRSTFRPYPDRITA